MTKGQTILAKKYADAFLNVFIDKLSYEDMSKISAASDFLVAHHALLSFLTWPVIKTEVKVRSLHELLQKFSLDHPFDKLVALLASSKRLHLINAVLKQIYAIYMKRKNMVHVSITSSHQLHESDLATIKQFLVNIAGTSIIYDYTVDKKLIAGIRLQSDVFLWEYSIRKQLAQMKLPIVR